MRSLALPLAALAFALAGGGCGGNDKAGVLVRWRLMDGLTGVPADGCRGTSGQGPGYCCVRVGGYNIGIERIRLRVERVDIEDSGLQLTDVTLRGFCMECSSLEYSTGPVLEPGTYKLAVEAWSCGRIVGDAPAPLVRILPPRGLANVQVQAIRILPSDALDPMNPGAGARCESGAPPSEATCSASATDLGMAPVDLRTFESGDGL